MRRQVNAYGVFGSITKKRFELTLEFKHATAATMRAGDAASRDAPWQELEFKCKPDRLQKLPCFVTPYHYRLDWETWIHVTALGEHQVHVIRDSGGSEGQNNLDSRGSNSLDANSLIKFTEPNKRSRR